MKKKLKKLTAFDVFMHIIGFLLLAIVAYPLILVLSNSFSNPSLVAQGKVVFFPKEFTLMGYEAVFENKDLALVALLDAE